MIGRKGAYRGVHYADRPFYVIDTAFYLRPKTEIDARWAYYQLLTHDINGMDSGSAIPSTSRDAFYTLPVRVPPLPEQHAIASILGALDDKIDLNRRMNETLEAMAQALLERIHHSSVPELWPEVALGDIVHLARSGVDPAKSPEEAFDHYSIPAFDTEKLPMRDHGADIKSNKYLVTSGDILVSKLNPQTPRVWLPRPSVGRRAVASTEFLVVQPKSGMTTEYLYTFLSSSGFSDAFSSLVTGTTGSRQRVQPTDFLQMKVRCPPPAAVATFTADARPVLQLVDQRRRENELLRFTRDALLPKLLSGELRVRAAETLVEAAV